MCGIAGLISLDGSPISDMNQKLDVMGAAIQHRGPDGSGNWVSEDQTVGFVHKRLSIIDLSDRGAQPMSDESGLVLSFNGEIYNYIELIAQYGSKWRLRSKSDTEVLLKLAREQPDYIMALRGMFAFSLFDPLTKKVTLCVDRFGIKQIYYILSNGILAFASEIKALLPFILPEISRSSLVEYLHFQIPLSKETLFKNIYRLQPGEVLKIENGQPQLSFYWQPNFVEDSNIKYESAVENVQRMVEHSVNLHTRSDVKFGAYLSGGLDSSIIAALASESENFYGGFHGRFTDYSGYDESTFAQSQADFSGLDLHVLEIKPQDFLDNISSLIYHMDFPVAGPGVFPQYMVSKLASEHVKVVLGGQGGDELFGGYARFLMGYLDGLLSKAILGGESHSNFAGTIGDIESGLSTLREYEPLARYLFAEGLFEELPDRYFRIVDRSRNDQSVYRMSPVERSEIKQRFLDKFNKSDWRKNPLGAMLGFDFRYLLPGLLHVEDRVSMAHGLESRVPLIDSDLFEYVSQFGSSVHFKDGATKGLFRAAFRDKVSDNILSRRDKMGFPVPLSEWVRNDLKEYFYDILGSKNARDRSYLADDFTMEDVLTGDSGSRKVWGLISLELWQQQFIDNSFYHKPAALR